MARLRPVPRQARRAQRLELGSLSTDDLVILALGKDLCALPDAAASSAAGKAQAALRDGDHLLTIAILKELLRTCGLRADRKRYVLVGPRLGAIRNLRGVSQASLAKAIGYTAGQVSHVETGRSTISLRCLLMTLEVLDTTVEALGVK